MTNPITVNPYDPLQLVDSVARALSGPIKTGTVTYDVDFGSFARWIYVGTSGDLSYLKWDGTTEVLPNLAAGVWHPIPAIRVTTANTTIAANQLRWGS